MKKLNLSTLFLSIRLLLGVLIQNGAHADEGVDVSKFTEKYWAQGKESELGIIQNRKYTSTQKLELGIFTGTIASDPFLSVKNYGISLGYHFSPYFSLHGIAWKTSVSPSDAYHTFQQQVPGGFIDTNAPQSFYALEAQSNILYGKVSLLGSTIIYVDIFLLGGLGMTNTVSSSDLTPFIGIGQKIHLSQTLSLQLAYQIMHYQETILSSNPSLNQTVVGQRSNTSDAITLGFSFLIGH